MKKLFYIFLLLIAFLYTFDGRQAFANLIHNPGGTTITTPIEDTPLKDWGESYPDHSEDMDTTIPGYTPSEETGGTTVTTPVHEQDNDDNTVFNDNGVYEDAQDVKFPENDSQIDHIFRDTEGHFTQNTPQNREIILNTVKPDNYKGVAQGGKQVFTETLPNGKQVWVEVRNGVIQNAGINDIPRNFISGTGLK